MILPPINAGLNTISTILLITGFVFIKKGNKEAHRKTMVGALISSALFLGCYLVYHYNVRHVEFPKEYVTARKVYFTILIPHVILAIINLPLIIILVVAAARGKFETHKKVARITFPSWLFVSITGILVYLMLYQWFPPTAEAKPADSTGLNGGPNPVTSVPTGAEVVQGAEKVGDLVFSPMFQSLDAEAGQDQVEVSFTIKNEGAEAIEITELESGCECLLVELDENPISPVSVSTLTGIFDISKMRGTSEKKITVSAAGQKRPVFLVTRIEIAPLYELSESMTTWKVGAAPDPKVVEFRVLRDEPIHVVSAESKRKEVTCELTEVESGRLYHLTLTPESTDSTLLGIVRIETDCEIEEHARPLAYFSIQ